MITSILLSGAIIVGALAGDDVAKYRPDLEAYHAAAARAGHDAKAHVRLALWCEAHGLSAERVKQLALAVLYDPTNALARGLSGLVFYQGKWRRPDEISNTVGGDPHQKELVRQYLERRARTSDRADAQLKLAVWCEETGLRQQATAHFHQVLRLDPSQEIARKHLGFKKVGGHWIKPEKVAFQKQEFENQKKASKHWQPLLEKHRDGLASKDKTRRAGAEKGLGEVTDPLAVPAVWITFAMGNPARQKVAVSVLGQIDSPGASRALATLAILSRSPEVRQIATQSLRRRDPREFAPLLIAMLRDPVKYERKNVNGPGSPGELLIKQKDANLKRIYSPLVPPNVPLLPTDFVTTDSNGLPLVIRGQVWYMEADFHGDSMAAAMANAASFFGVNNSTSVPLASQLRKAGLPANVSQHLAAVVGGPPQVIIEGQEYRGAAGGLEACVIAGELVFRKIEIPTGQMNQDAQRSAQVAQQQLTNDIQTIEAYNAPIDEINRSVRQILADVIGTDLGAERQAWESWQVNLFGYANACTTSEPTSERPTFVEQVPVAYQPQAAPLVVDQAAPPVIRWHHSCFGAGTLVQTLQGHQVIEKLRAGDEVLTQDPKTGELRYQPIVAVYHNPPNSTSRIELDDDVIVATGIHRFWKAGKGWVMTRELKPGDRLRTLSGVSTVKSVSDEVIQPVYNLQVVDGESFFVGKIGALAHDNSLIDPTPDPFDAASLLGEKSNR
jgi:tetratricopeptide (TPR) repeat protein